MPIINTFGGIFPRMAWHLLPENAATVAHNVKLRNGKLEAWRERESIAMAVDDATTLVAKGCCYLTWKECVTVADYLPDYGRMFITGRTNRPEVFTLKDCEPTYYYLGVPTPTTAPTIEGTESQGRDCSARSYVYTYVNIFGEESAPSPSSIQLTIKDGDTVEISGIIFPPDGYGVESINIYRTGTAFRVGDEKEQDPLTDYLWVSEIQLPTTDFTDTVLEMFLGPALTTREFRLPPRRLRQIRHVNGTGVLAGVTTNQVHFSTNMLPYNWPAEYDLTLPYNIINMVTVDQYAIVSTDGFPYVISVAPSCEPRQCRSVLDVDIPLPDISCGHPNSAISTPFGMVYSSKDGLVLVSPDAKFQILTSAWFGTEDWIKVRPDTVRLAYWRGYIICVTDILSFMLEIDGSTYDDFQLGSLVTIDDEPVDMWASTNGELLFLEGQLIHQWNAGDTLRHYMWESRELSFGGESAPTTAKIRTNNITFRLLSPIPNLYYERKVMDEKPFRLGRLGRHLNYRVGLYGTGTVDFLDLGMMNTTINRGL